MNLTTTIIKPWKYHVFLSFRGEDTRKGFTDHLHTALKQRGIITFLDDELNRGEVISNQLLQAIDESLVSLVILSESYASSSWCLDELQRILESKNFLGRQVIPIFYKVDPSDVRHQRGTFALALQKHGDRFADNKEKVQSWKDALEEVANISGYNSTNRHEAKLIEEISAAVVNSLFLQPDGSVSLGPWGGPGGTTRPFSFKAANWIKEITIYYGQCIIGISVKDANGNRYEKIGDEPEQRNKRTIKIAGPSEYVTSITGTYGKHKYPDPVVTSLSINTNLTTHGPFGTSNGAYFSMPMQNALVIGFHGRSGGYIDAIGTFVKPAPTI